MRFIIQHFCNVIQEEYSALDSQLKAQSAAAESAKLDYQRHHHDLKTHSQTLQQQFNDLRSEHQQLQDRHDSLQSMSASSTHVSQTAVRPSMLNGLKAMLQKLNGSRQQLKQLPIFVPSLTVGHRECVHVPPHSAHTGSSSAPDFRHDPQGTLQQPQGHSHVLEGAAQRPVTRDAATAEVAEPSGQQEDDWDVLLRFVRASQRDELVFFPTTQQHMQTCIYCFLHCCYAFDHLLHVQI